MLMMFGPALRKAPFERAMPFNDKDLFILINPEIGIRLCNITTEQGLEFCIRDFITLDDEKVFKCDDFEQKMKDFVEILPSRIERFFVTEKSDYIFFDLEEQKYLRKIMSRPGLSCSVELYKFDKNKPAEKIDMLSLPHKESRFVLNMMSAWRVRAIVDVREYYQIAKDDFDEKEERRARYEEFMKRAKPKDPMEDLFKKYPKLKTLDTKAKVDKYFKKLTVKYHPDNYRDRDTTQLCADIRDDLAKVKDSNWYINLSDK